VKYSSEGGEASWASDQRDDQKRREREEGEREERERERVDGECSLSLWACTCQIVTSILQLMGRTIAS
jgi:hypothetical protein